MANTLKLLTILTGLIVLSIMSTVAMQWLMHYDINNIENTINATQELRYEIQTLSRKQAEFIVSNETSQALRIKRSTATIADSLKTLAGELESYLPPVKIQELEQAFNRYVYSFNQIQSQNTKIGLTASSGLQQELQKHKKHLLNMMANIDNSRLLSQYLQLLAAEDQLLNTRSSSELLLERYYDQLNQITALIKSSGYPRANKLLVALDHYQSLTYQLSMFQNDLGKNHNSGMYSSLAENQRNLIRTAASTMKQLNLMLKDKQGRSQVLLVGALLWITMLLCQAGIVVWKSLLQPLVALQHVTDDALIKHGLTAFPSSEENLPDYNHPVVASVNKLVSGIESRVGNIKRFAKHLNDDVKLIIESINHANTAYCEQASKLRRNEISLKSLLRTVYKNSSVAKKAYVETSRVDKKLHRYSSVVLESMEQLQNLKSCTKKIGNDAAQFSLYGSLAITSNKNRTVEPKQDEQLNALKRQLQQLAINNRRNILHMNKSLQFMMESHEDAADYSGNSAQQMKNINLTVKTLMDSTLQQANKFNTIKAATLELYNDAKAGMIETKCLSMAGKNAVSNIQNMCQLLDYFNISEPVFDDDIATAESPHNVTNASLKLELIHYQDASETAPEQSTENKASHANKASRKKPDLQLIVN